MYTFVYRIAVICVDLDGERKDLLLRQTDKYSLSPYEERSLWKISQTGIFKKIKEGVGSAHSDLPVRNSRS